MTRIFLLALAAICLENCHSAEHPSSFFGSYRGSLINDGLQTYQIGLTFTLNAYSGSQQAVAGDEIIIEGEYSIEDAHTVKFSAKKKGGQENLMHGAFTFSLVGKTLTLQKHSQALKITLTRLPER